MTPITWQHGVHLARTRSIVRLDNGRLATVISWPIPTGIRHGRTTGNKVKVQLQSGTFLSVRPDTVSEVWT